MALAPGARVGPYEVAALIGEGGMGKVWRARHVALNRDDALKILPDTFASDPERLARFRREAQVLASLNHPNIAHVYGLEQADGAPAIVMELVEGDTLADRIARGPVPFDEALPIAKQIAEALETAHEQGIIHRDLKPANIKITANGHVKVLDFGLAKLVQPPGSGELAAGNALSLSPTITSPAMTGVGVLLGTAAYMAPEQAKGRPADKRSDIWAFGCVLYEMLTGRRAFDGDDVSDTLASVLRSEPDWTALPATIPDSVRTLLRRALAKDRLRRLADIADARLELDDASTTSAARAVTVDRRPKTSRYLWIVATVTTLAAVAASYVAWNRTPPPGPSIQFIVSPPTGRTVGFDFVAGTGAANLPIAVSPDGRQLAMVARSGEGRTTLWIRSLDSATARELGGTDGATAPFWSPDGRFLAFYADGKLKKIAAAGGPAVTLCSASSFNSGAWSNLGVIVFARAGGSGVGGALLRVADSGGEPVTATTLATGEVLHIRPAFLPDGRHFFYRATSQAGGGGIFIASLDSADRRRILTEGVGNVQYSRGHLLFVRDTTLFAQPFDARSLVITGDPRPVAESVQTNGQGVPVGDFSVTDAGVLAYQTGNPAETGSELTWFDRAGKVLGTVGNRAAYWDLELSPDGQQASVSIRRPQGDTDIWIVDLVRNVPTRFTFNQGLIQNRSIWSPDGRRIVFSAGRVALADQGDARGGLTLFEKPTAGGPERPLPATSQDKTQALLLPWSWSPDGRAIVYSSTSGQNGPSNLWVLPLSGGEPTPLLPSKFTHAYGRLSPDGHSLTFASNESGQLQVYVVPFPDTTSAKIQISTAGGSEPRWRGDGKEIFYLDVNTLMAADVSVDHSQLKVGLPKRLFQFRYTGLPRSNYAVTPDGQRFLFITRAEASLSEPITVVVNWDRQQ